MKKILLFLFVLSLSVSSLLAQDKLSVLFVHDSNYNPDRADILKAAITAAGYTYSNFDAVAAGTTPNEELLSEHELVIWYAGDDQTAYLWADGKPDNAALQTYLDNGGMLWLQSKNLFYKTHTVEDVFTTGDFVFDYLGISKYAIRTPSSSDVTIGIPQFDLVTENNFTSTVDPLTWAWGTMYGIDAFEIIATAKGIYTTGPSTHQHAGYYTSVYNELTDGFKVLTTSTETGKLETVAMTDQFILETLTYFNTFANTTKTAVTGFSIVASFTTVQPFGSLQLSVDALPIEADNKSVAWAIVSGETSGSIDDNGLFTATTTLGTVVISATTNDGSAITEQITITVAEKLSVLLIHDNDNAPTNINAIKAAIESAGYSYSYFDAVTDNVAPTLEVLSNHELVIWYTGNDGSGLEFWNGNDTENEALKTYLDNGGMLWLQGRDFLYDVYGGAPDNFIAGDFVYDYLGIKTYVGQSHGDDAGVGVEQLDLVAGNVISATVDPIIGKYSTIWYADALEITDNAQGIYKMGPTGYVYDAYYACIYNEVTDGFKVLTYAFETAEFQAAPSLIEPVFQEALDYFNTFTNTSKTYLTDVTVTATDGAIVLGLELTLQLTADILPIDASNQTVSWTISEAANASINQNGLLTATAIPEIVTITATANDGSGVSDTYEIEIKSLIPDKVSILLVHDNSSDAARIELVKTAITTAGYEYTVFDAVDNAQAPSAEFLSGFELVIWYTGNDEDATYFWNGNHTDNVALKTYLDNGGMLWVQGLTFLYDRYGVAPVDFVAGDFAYDYLGVQKFAVSSYVDEAYTGGVTQLDLVANSITTIDPLNWIGDAAMQYVAGCELNTATGVYQMGPAGYSLAGNSTAFYNEVTDEFKALTFTFDPSQLKTNLNPLYQEVLDYFNSFANTEKVHVYEVTVTSETGDISITAENGTLQLVATVLPESAENKTVTWSLGEGSVPATISPDGLLTASGTIEGNGPVFAIATSNDKPEFADTLEISIIGQAMTGFTVLLVNDHDYSDRYLNINTALTESGYAHILYNTETAGVAPSADYMSHFDMVFWYTGNDYEELYLWDIDYNSTTFTEETGLDIDNKNQVKANPAIIDYIDNDGIFFHTGIEIMRTIWGRPDDDFGGAGQTIDFASGDFIYDYMGVSQYVRTGKNDDGTSHIEITAENEVTTTSPISFAWSTMWHAAAYAITDNATSLYTLPSSSNVWSGFPTIIMNTPASGGTVIMNGSELAMLGDGTEMVQATVNAVTKEFIDYFANLTPSSINNIERNTLSFSIYPNPTSDDLNIRFEMTSSDKVEIIIFNNTGHRVIQQKMNARPGINSQKLNVRNLSSGIYFLSIHTNNSISSSKFIIK